MEYKLIQSSKIEEDDAPITKILLNRGIEREDIMKYLNPLDEYILPPEDLYNMRAGAELLAKHIAMQSQTLVVVDSDQDGYASAALLLNYLHRLVPAYVENCVRYVLHEKKAHGIIEEAITDDIQFLIVPDAASNEREIVSKLKGQGIETLILDHHHTDTPATDAVIINPMICGYPNKFLCGGGVVYKFVKYLDDFFNVAIADDYIDLAGLSEIGDIMDVRPLENRVIISKGIDNIRNPFISTMAERNAYSLGSEITPFGIAFYIVPFVNAVTRVGTMEEKKLIFESFLEYKAYNKIPSTKRGCKGQFETLVEQAVRTATNVKNRQKRLRDEATEKIEAAILERSLLDNKLIIICLSEGEMVRGLTGLVATQIANKYQHPTLILHETYDGDKLVWSGSGRGVNNVGFDDFRGFLADSGLMVFAQGHAQAFGAAIEDINLDKLIEYSNSALANYKFDATYRVDFITSTIDLDPDDILEIASYAELWGHGVEEPLIAIEKVSITKNNVQLMAPDRNPTLKISMPNGTNFIKFRTSTEEYESIINGMTDYTSKVLTIIGRCEKNEWNGRINPQIIIEDYEVESVGYNF